MKNLILIFALVSNIGYSQTKSSNSKHLKIIKKVYKEYISYQEDSDLEENKIAMTKAIKSLKSPLVTKEIDLLIEVWLQYDPSDFPTKDLVFPILKKNYKIVLLEIDKLLKKEIDHESSTFNDLTALRKSL